MEGAAEFSRRTQVSPFSSCHTRLLVLTAWVVICRVGKFASRERRSCVHEHADCCIKVLKVSQWIRYQTSEVFTVVRKVFRRKLSSYVVAICSLFQAVQSGSLHLDSASRGRPAGKSVVLKKDQSDSRDRRLLSLVALDIGIGITSTLETEDGCRSGRNLPFWRWGSLHLES